MGLDRGAHRRPGKPDRFRLPVYRRQRPHLSPTHRYRLFGLTLGTRDALEGFPESDSCRPEDLRYEYRVGEPARGPLPAPLFRSQFRNEAGRSRLTVHRLPGCQVVRFPEVAEFHLQPDRIVAWAEGEQRRAAAQVCLLGPVLAIWLELRGVLALHASAVVVAGRAVVFLSESEGGKSSLAAEFVAAGRPLLCDDIVALERRAAGWVARPGLPQLRLWPEAASRLAADWRAWPRVHPAHQKRRVLVGGEGVGSWCERTVPLGLLCLPEPAAADERTGGGCRIQELAGQSRLIALVRHSFAARVVEALGLQGDRLQRLADLAQAAPVLRLTFPRGLERLPEVRQRIERELRAVD